MDGGDCGDGKVNGGDNEDTGSTLSIATDTSMPYNDEAALLSGWCQVVALDRAAVLVSLAKAEAAAASIKSQAGRGKR